ncbi:S9 family peptidase [Olivibacter sitiensis]|uniref:S9 family peptidase n=1 Tax=Olivibacter sitiensis TaxID=376470 RepID=UPI00040F1255|nr:DPP IV N-terminal domain-containing protein [Olivibacter sitiensis]
MKKFFLFTAAVVLATALSAQQKTESNTPKANYQLASRFSPEKLKKLIFSTDVDPHWLKKSNRFWYTYETPSGKSWYIVDPVAKSQQQLFDNAALAAELSKVVQDPFDAQHLPIQRIKFTEDEQAIRFDVKSTRDTLKSAEDRKKSKNKTDSLEKKTYYLQYHLTSGKLSELSKDEKPKERASWASFTPDTSKVIFAKEYNLYWMDKANYEKALKDEKDSTIVEHQFTEGGIQYYAWGGDDYSETIGDKESEENKKKRKGVRLIWSPDGKHFVLSRTDNRKVKDLWVINNTANPRPTLERYKYQMPGESDAPIRELYLFNFEDKSSKKIDVSGFKDQEISIWTAPTPAKARDDEYRVATWLGDEGKFYFYRSSRDLKKIDMGTITLNGEVKILVEERSNVYLDIQRPYLIDGGKEFVFWSERDGWGHYYLYDGEGNLKNQITKGEFYSSDIQGLDEKTRTLYLTANGRENGEDPYYEHLYSIGLNGSGMKLLNSGDFNHQTVLDDDNRFFVNNFSRVNTVPQSALYDNTGKKVMDLQKADLSSLLAAGYQFPEPFKVKADDGITDLYGVMYKPFNFDSTKVYPMIEYVYPGPQTEAVNKSFGRSMDRIDRLAQFGYIVITVGNRGGHPARSKWYHTYGYGNLRDYGLADKKAAAEQLAARYPFIDVERVGITGHSGGGFMSTAAMLVYPDFFKVAVSGAGNHENNIYNRWWSERHHGVTERIDNAKGDTTFVYQIEKNPDLAKNLKGRLMLVTGDIDNNVHPANTIRMANALIKANKRFEFVIMPGQRHGFGDMTEYFFWKMGDYFNRYLMGDETERSVDLIEMNREVPLKR